MIKASQKPERTARLLDNYRSLIIAMAFILIGFSTMAQINRGVRQKINVKGYDYKELAADSLLRPPQVKLPLLARDSGSLAYVDSILWVWKGTQWDTVSGGTGASGAITNLESTLQWYRPENYGAEADGATDDAAAIQATIDAMPVSGGVLYFSAKAYLVGSEIRVNKPMSIIGAGANDPDYFGPGRTRILTISNTINIFRTVAAGITFRDIGFYNRSTGTVTAGSAIKIDSGGLGLRFQNLAISNFYDGIYFRDGGEWTMTDCQLMSNQHGRYVMYISRQDTPDGGDQSITNCHIFSGGVAGIKYHSGGGLKIVNTKFNNSRGVIASVFQNIPGKVAFDIDINGSTTDLVFVGNSVEGFTESGIRLRTSSGATFGNIVITGNQFTSATQAHTRPTIDISGVNNVSITGNSFKKVGSDTAIKISSSSEVEVASNALDTYTWPKAIMAFSCTKCNIQADYNLYTGKGPAQAVTGGTDALGSLVLSSTANATKGYIILGSAFNSAYNENNDRLGLGMNVPTQRLQVHGSIYIDSTGGFLKFPDGSMQSTAAGGGGGDMLLAGNNIVTGTVRTGASSSTSSLSSGSLHFQSLLPNNNLILSNAIWNGSAYQLLVNGYSTAIQSENGAFNWYTTSTSGLSGAAPSYTIPMSLTSAGLAVNGGINTNQGLSITKNGSNTIGSGPILQWSNAAGTRAVYSQLNARNGLDFAVYDTVTGNINRSFTINKDFVGYPSGFLHGQLKDSSFVDKHYVDSIIATVGGGGGGDVYLANNNPFTGSNSFIKNTTGSFSTVFRNANSGAAAETRLDIFNNNGSVQDVNGAAWFLKSSGAGAYANSMGFWSYENGPLLFANNGTEKVRLQTNGLWLYNANYNGSKTARAIPDYGYVDSVAALKAALAATQTFSGGNTFNGLAKYGSARTLSGLDFVTKQHLDSTVGSIDSVYVNPLHFKFNTGVLELRDPISRDTFHVTHVVGLGADPTFAYTSGAGTSPTTSLTTKGNPTDIAGTITIVTGGAGTFGLLVSALTFNVPYQSTPHVVISAGSADAAQTIFYVEPSTTGFNLKTTNSMLASKTYHISYHVIE